MRPILAAWVVASIVFSASAPRAEEKSYGEGRLDVRCTCNSGEKEVYGWLHRVEVPPHGLTLDLDVACKLARTNDQSANIKCKWWHKYRGVERAFESKLAPKLESKTEPQLEPPK